MESLERYAEAAFSAVLHRRGLRELPGLRQVTVVEVGPHRMRFTADFHSLFHTWGVGADDARCTFADARAWCRSREPQSLYARLFEDRLIEREVEVLHAQYRRLVELGASPDHCARAWRQVCEREEHVRQHHRRRVPVRRGWRLLELGDAPPQFLPVDIDWRSITTEVTVEEAPRPARGATATEIRVRQDEAMRGLLLDLGELVDNQLYRALIGDYNPYLDSGFGEIGTKEAQERGLKLLSDWLSPEQREEYSRLRRFTVIGSDTGKRYRINHGRQMNIDELDAKGRKVCGWCFLPEGQLVTGDVMLAQKIALETNESAALKVANRVGGIDETWDGEIRRISGVNESALGGPNPIYQGIVGRLDGVVIRDRDLFINPNGV